MNNFDLFNKKKISKKNAYDHSVSFVVLTFFLCSTIIIGWFMYLRFVKNNLYRSHKKSLEMIQRLEVAQKQYQQDLADKKRAQQQHIIEQNHKNCFFLSMLKDLSNELPSDIRINKLEFVDKHIIELHGESLSAKSLTNFVNNLKLKPCLKKCVLEGMTKKQTKEDILFDFIIKIYLSEAYGQDKKISV